jgi:hypothetical protein
MINAAFRLDYHMYILNVKYVHIDKLKEVCYPLYYENI